MQELMTEELAEGLPPLYATEGEGDPVALVHYFSCASGWDWWLTEYDPETGEAFGLVRGLEVEWGYFSLCEMEQLNRSRGFNAVERDEHFEPTRASALEGRRQGC